MNKLFKHTVCTMFVILSVCSCSKKKQNHTITTVNGIKHIRNKNIPVYKKIKLNLKKKVSVKGVSDHFDSTRIFTQPYKVKMDVDGNIYIADFKSCSIKKFDSAGNFLLNIGRLGSGPGEMESISNIVINRDTLLVYDYLKTISKFQLDGTFLSKLPFHLQNVIGFNKIIELTDSTQLAYALTFEKTDEKIDFIAKSGIFDYNGRELSVFCTNTLPVKEYHQHPVKLLQIEHIIASDHKGIVYQTRRNKDDYLIAGYDISGKKKIEISKNYRKVPFTTAEKDKIKANTGGQTSDNFNEFYDYRFSIYNLHVDKYENLWVQTRGEAESEIFSYDIFNKDGIYTGKYTFGQEDNEEKEFLEGKLLQIYFENDLMIIVDSDNIIINAYEYDLIQEKHL